MHSITLLLILVLLMPYAALIPMPAIAAILFGAADKIFDISVGEKDEVLILRMRSVEAIDATALHSQMSNQCI